MEKKLRYGYGFYKNALFKKTKGAYLTVEYTGRIKDLQLQKKKTENGRVKFNFVTMNSIKYLEQKMKNITP